MNWKCPFEFDPPRYEEIVFRLGDGFQIKGFVEGYEEIRKCDFIDYLKKHKFSCDTNETFDKRVIEWQEYDYKPE